MDSLFSFPVGLFHPLQHAGLSRRTTYYRLHVEVNCTLPNFAQDLSLENHKVARTLVRVGDATTC
jgi:hypothetical protein